MSSVVCGIFLVEWSSLLLRLVVVVAGEEAVAEAVEVVVSRDDTSDNKTNHYTLEQSFKNSELG